MRKKLFILILLACFVVGCVRPKTTKEFLENQGYFDIEITGWRPLSRTAGAVFTTGFIAFSPLGKRVSGAVTERINGGKQIIFD